MNKEQYIDKLLSTDTDHWMPNPMPESVVFQKKYWQIFKKDFLYKNFERFFPEGEIVFLEDLDSPQEDRGEYNKKVLQYIRTLFLVCEYHESVGLDSNFRGIICKPIEYTYGWDDTTVAKSLILDREGNLCSSLSIMNDSIFVELENVPSHLFHLSITHYLNHMERTGNGLILGGDPLDAGNSHGYRFRWAVAELGYTLHMTFNPVDGLIPLEEQRITMIFESRKDIK